MLLNDVCDIVQEGMRAVRDKARLVGEELRLQVEETRKFLENERQLRRAGEAAAVEAEARLTRRLEQASADISALRQQVLTSTCPHTYGRHCPFCQISYILLHRSSDKALSSSRYTVTSFCPCSEADMLCSDYEGACCQRTYHHRKLSCCRCWKRIVTSAN